MFIKKLFVFTIGVYFIAGTNSFYAENISPKTEQIFKSVNISGPVLNLKTDCGAKGNGISNDTEAFQKAAQIINEAGSGKLIIPDGVYIVGKQTHQEGEYPYWKMQDIFKVENINGLIVEGQGVAVLKIADGMHYGSFDKNTGSAYDPVKEGKFQKNRGFFDKQYAVSVGRIIAIFKSKNIIIQGIELNGNIAALDVGGVFGDHDRQLLATAIYLHSNSNVFLKDIKAHHNGLDGVYITFIPLNEKSPPVPHVLLNVVSEYNGRQGLSWAGGIGLTAINCKFNNTGRSRFSSAPAAGLDIEGNTKPASVCRKGLFKNCEFLNNTGCGIVADKGNGAYSEFENCTVWGTSNWAIWGARPGMSFKKCKIYGAIVNLYGDTQDPSLAISFHNCEFEDKKYLGYEKCRGDALVDAPQAANVIFSDCRFTANAMRCFNIGYKSTLNDNMSFPLLRNCIITHKASMPRNKIQSFFRNVRMENVRFQENLPDGLDDYSIITSNVIVGKGVIIEGPKVRWKPGNTTGIIPETTPDQNIK